MHYYIQHPGVSTFPTILSMLSFNKHLLYTLTLSALECWNSHQRLSLTPPFTSRNDSFWSQPACMQPSKSHKQIHRYSLMTIKGERTNNGDSQCKPANFANKQCMTLWFCFCRLSAKQQKRGNAKVLKCNFNLYTFIVLWLKVCQNSMIFERRCLIEIYMWLQRLWVGRIDCFWKYIFLLK